LPLVEGVMIVTKDVENDHRDEPHQPYKQHRNDFLCHGCVSLRPVWFIWLVWFNQTNQITFFLRWLTVYPASRVPNLKYARPLS